MGKAQTVLMFATWLLASTVSSSAQLRPKVEADDIYLNAKVETMDASSSVAEAVAIRDGSILAVGTNQEMQQQYQGPLTRIRDLHLKAAILPGFIDTHSHLISFGVFSDASRWVDISSVNVLLKPPVGNPRCKNKKDYQKCFIPVRNQDDVVHRLREAVARMEATPGASAKILGFNYDPSRLGHSKECPDPNGVAFDCPNFEDGHALKYLDEISTKYPILITSESGHIVYVNTVELHNLHICGVSGNNIACHAPIFNIEMEEKLAKQGQLDEDLALWAIEQVGGGDAMKAINTAAQAYADHGYTLAQEGAAGLSEVLLYEHVTRNDLNFPLTVAALIFDVDSPPDNLDNEIKIADAARTLAKGNSNFFIAAIKAFADGSTQGFTAFLKKSYPHLPPYLIFNDLPGYRGFPDFTKEQLAQAAKKFHAHGFPIAIHMNGDQAIPDVLDALLEATLHPDPPPPETGNDSHLRDFLIHFQMGSSEDLDKAKAIGAVTFLTEDLYYYGLPMCQQILGPEQVGKIYPAGEAVQKGLRVSLHPDTDVTPPYPLFAIWAAKTRKTQQPLWYPNAGCPIVMDSTQAISIRQGIKAYTMDAAWMYGLEDKLGSIEPNKIADLVILSADPIDMEAKPDLLTTVRVLATVHRGKYHRNRHAAEKPIWPD
jgi:predicted amidohydrolase YtcJ